MAASRALSKSNSHTALESYLKNRIFGQDHIITEVVKTLYISLAGLGNENKPVASFLFTGPTGVGKTEFAIELAKVLGYHMERFDMSEFADDYSARNLTGGNKGLVGYEDGGLLTNAIMENPECVLLLDEIEKADKVVYNTFLQVLDYGKLKDTQGRCADFTKTIIIMTSNLGATEKRGIGFGANENLYKEYAVSEFLTPEFRNRIDKILEFNPISQKIAGHITDKFLSDFSHTLKQKKILLEVTPEARQLISELGFSSEMGARSVYRAINNEFKSRISEEILFGCLHNGGTAQIHRKDNALSFDFSRSHSHKSKENECTFKYAEEAHAYAKANPGVIITRAPSGFGYVVK